MLYSGETDTEIRCWVQQYCGPNDNRCGVYSSTLIRCTLIRMDNRCGIQQYFDPNGQEVWGRAILDPNGQQVWGRTIL